MSLEAWGDDDEYMRGPDGYVTEEHAREMVQEALAGAMAAINARLGAFREGHANDAQAWEHYNSGFMEGMQEALSLVEAESKRAD